MYFAVTATVSGVDISTIGLIFMGAGALTLILGLVMNAQRTNTSHEVTERRHERRRPPYDE